MADELREAMRNARRDSGLDFAKFASLAGFSVAYLRSAENGNRAVTIEIAEAYDRVLATGGRFAEVVREQEAVGVLAWDRTGAITALAQLLGGGGVDRRSFATASAGTIAGIITSWRSGLEAAVGGFDVDGRAVNADLIEHIDARLDHLRHLDDELGSGDLAQLARNELALIVRLIKRGGYDERTEQRLYAQATEASRQTAWDLFDSGRHDAALRYFTTALRASAGGKDRIGGAYAASFLAVQLYSTPHRAKDAVDALEAATAAVAAHGTPRMRAMLAARSARAHSKIGNRIVSAHMLHLARAELDLGPHQDDPPTLYWVTPGEIEMIAGSSALELGDPTEALRRFDAARAADYPGEEQYPRSHAIYMARAAEAHLATRDLDAAVAAAGDAMRCLGGVGSARSTSTLAGLRAKLAKHAGTPVVNDFLEASR